MSNVFDFSFIIVSWNVRPLLARCLQSLQHELKNVRYEVIVVDNASQDGSADLVADQFPWVHLIKNTDNLGFGRANNQGVIVAQGTYIVFLNDDTEILSDWDGLLLYMRNHPELGVLGPKLLNVDRSIQPSVRHFPELSDQLLYLFKLHIIFPHSQPMKRFLASSFDYAQEADVDQVMGACMIMPIELVRQLKAFDPGYPNWFEEIDLCKRVIQVGKKVRYAPVISLIHVKGASFSQLRPVHLQRMYNYSMRRYFRKWHSFPNYLCICMVQPISLLLSGLVQLTGMLGLNVKKFKPQDV